jgi:hypothetical protein
MPRVVIDLIRGLGLDPLTVGLTVFGLRPTEAGTGDGGIGLAPFVAGTAELVFPLAASGQVQLELEGAVASELGVALLLRPGGHLELKLLGPAAGDLKVALRVRWLPAPEQDRIVLLAAEGVGIDAADAFVELIASSGGIELGVGISDGAVGAKPTGDGFLAKVLPAEGLTAPFDLVLAWSSSGGLRVRGGAGLEATIQVGAQLGPIIIESVYVGFRITERGLRMVVATSVSLSLGPFAAAISRVGVQLELGFPAAGGNLGPAQLGLGFSPPTGAGLAIKTPAISGGGFLRFEAGRYSGVFELTIVNTVSVKVIGIITTRLPDGSPGFALLLMITAEGFTPIQLGMGFVLTGIGGLIALNRTIDVDAVRGGLSSGVLDSVLFAKDPVANADRILATLETIFPMAPDRLLIGPLAEIGWGSPPVVKMRLALLLEIPQPLRVVLLAALAVVLPNADAPVVELHVDAIGVLDLGRGELALDASLHHSRLWKFALTGDLALRLNWGENPMFLLSVGGFHPAFTPPAGLRRLERLTFSLSDSENPRIRFETYLAVTANTIQLGARVSVRAEANGFGVDGGGAFDALVQWVPFGLDVRFEAWIRVFGPSGTLCAARLALQVTGPQPWHVVGVVNLQVLVFQVELSVDFRVGDPLAPVLAEVVDVLQLIWDELTRPGSWVTALPPGRTSGATLGGPAASDTGQPLLVHPLGSLSVRQKVVPLGTRVTRIGALRPRTGARSYDLDVESPAGIAAAPLLDRFAPSQFTDLSEDEKLSAPSFVSWPAGLSFAAASGGLPTGLAVGSDLRFETLDLTSFDEPAAPDGGSVPGTPQGLDTPTGPAAWAGLAVVPT